MTIIECLKIIQSHAHDADEKARRACLRSKYSIQDYWLCIEFRLQRLHDEIAMSAHLPNRCPSFEFRLHVQRFRKAEMKNVRRQGMVENGGGT